MSCPLKCLSWSWKKTVIRPKKWPQMTSLTSEYQAGVCISFANHLPPPHFPIRFFQGHCVQSAAHAKSRENLKLQGGTEKFFPPGEKIWYWVLLIFCVSQKPPFSFFVPISFFRFFFLFLFFLLIHSKAHFPPGGGGADRKINTPVYLKPSWLTFQMKGNDTSSWFVHIKNQSEVIWPL